ncbi:Aminotransferase [Polystyrenella longa]|uniref:Aminotransferase n=1 Tax=Polystyrenella longa TaxID=2528007 RepID=A0A518CQH8_9PLAN|nr:DegT/DnrJ/EryC1/StrS family aminotransferase [Polystyrenella longa]QDU81486.1 Aminotransferase [Polystyrenella longa]
MATAPLQNTPVPFIDLVAQYEPLAEETLAAVSRLMSEQKFILGEEVELFEQEIATYCTAPEAIGCSSGTDALILALMALNIGAGDEVITTPFTFFATGSSIHRVGAKPVFVDIDPITYNIDPAKIEAAITPKTKAIMPVHIFGQCAEMDQINSIAAKHNLFVVEDAAQAIGSEYRGRRAGVLGDICCFSFFPTKNLGGAGDGGMLTTRSPELATRLKQLRVHGQTSVYYHQEVGLNARLDALQAAILRVKLKSLDDWTEARQRNAECYNELFQHYDLEEVIVVPESKSQDRHVYNQYTVRVLDDRRDDVIQNLRDQQIGAAVYYPVSLHLQPCFSYLGYKKGDMPQSEAASNEVLSLPIFAELVVSQLETVVRGIAEAIAPGSAENIDRLYSESEELPQKKVA